MRRDEIWKIYGTDYRENTIRLLGEAGLSDLIPDRNCRIGIKPNLVVPAPACLGATTHPEIVAGIIEYLQENGFRNLTIMEGSWVGDRTEEAVRECGFTELTERYGVPFIDTQKEHSEEVRCDGLAMRICDCVRDIDFLINVPVLKGHCQTRVTCALKNMKGLIPNSEKRRFHSEGLHRPIACLNTQIRQDFIVVDHICGDLDFEDGGNPVVRNCIMAARDPVLTDTYACRLMQIDPAEVPYIGMACGMGVGSMDLDLKNVRVCGGEPDREELLPEGRKVVELKDAVCEVESCSACYGYLLPAMDRLKQEGLLDDLLRILSRHDTRLCIGQGYRGQKGRFGIGNCTSKFDFSVKGCPPTEQEIYLELKDLIGRMRND